MIRRALFLSLLLLAPVAAAGRGNQGGKILPPWTPGTLDIHQLATGKGNAAFFVLPDGTTLLVDAGDAADRVPATPAVPDGSRDAGGWIVRYIRQMTPHLDEPAIDYAVLTHFHSDHMGFVSEEAPFSDQGDYRLAGLTTVADAIPVRTLLDRGWPDYDYPAPITHLGMENYRRFLAWQTEHRALRVERFAPGRRDQIVLVHDMEAYPGFEIRNLAANGEVWTGEGTATKARFPPLEDLAEEDRPSENMCSLAFLLAYGDFDFFTGGDLPGWPEPGAPPWWDVETPIARAIGEVDVQVVNHHGSLDPSNPFFLAALRPRVHILPTWSSTHPAPVVLKRLLSERVYPEPRDVFATYLREATRLAIGPRATRLASGYGHIVVRVEPGGRRYRIYVLDPADLAIRSEHGPYDAR